MKTPRRALLAPNPQIRRHQGSYRCRLPHETGAAAHLLHRDLGLTRPEIKFVDLAHGMGVEASRVETAEAFAAELEVALAARGPRVIDVALA
jgi:thiamine pyrophosphate-dependent acetolactate synthase large subunit-like protein